jgi:hypothetical protein
LASCQIAVPNEGACMRVAFDHRVCPKCHTDETGRLRRRTMQRLAARDLNAA